MKPILFNDEMVRAILDGRKTKTRRLVKPQPELRANCPFGQVGDRLWVKETFCLEIPVLSGQLPPFNDGRPIRWEYEGLETNPERADTWFCPHYRATDPTPELSYEDTDGEPTVKWKPSIHMPRWASRITLEITDIRIERVQEITKEDAKAEGIIDGGCLNCGRNEPCGCLNPLPDARDAFANVWEKIYAKKGLGWYANPWVWVIGFRRV